VNRNDFIRIINDPAVIDRQMTTEVKELLDLFPWFHSAHLLLLKGLHNTGDVKFENQLRQSAVHIADRELLYHILYKPVFTEHVKSDKPSEAPAFQLEQPDNQQVVIESGRNSSDIINELEKTSLILPHAEPAPLTGSENLNDTIVVTTESDLDESASVMLVFDDGDSHIEETILYMDPSISTPDEGELLELEENMLEISDEIQQKPAENESEVADKGNRSQIQARLIDNFIMLNPRIEHPREKSDKPNEDISKPFVEESGSFITETLARIYINQGYYSKAIDIYEKLSLKFPEKSSYFATQIEKVKELIK
jgi:hypothetical protein